MIAWLRAVRAFDWFRWPVLVTLLLLFVAMPLALALAAVVLLTFGFAPTVFALAAVGGLVLLLEAARDAWRKGRAEQLADAERRRLLH